MIIENIEKYLKRGLITRIVETELHRYLNFFDETSKENRTHAESVKDSFPRWSIILGYYAMHDITKLFLAKRFFIKVELKVHKITIEIMKALSADKEILKLLELGYEAFIAMANDLAEAKEERVKAQYYTGSEFMKGKYKEKATQFLSEVVDSYLQKMRVLLTESSKEENNESKFV